MMNNYKCTINEISFFDQLSKNQEKTKKDTIKINNSNDVIADCF